VREAGCVCERRVGEGCVERESVCVCVCKARKGECVCACVGGRICVRVGLCGVCVRTHVFVTYQDTNLYNDMGMT